MTPGPSFALWPTDGFVYGRAVHLLANTGVLDKIFED